MFWMQKLLFLMRQPVGVSLRNGRGVSGILCGVDNEMIYIMEYLYASQFAMKHYRFSQIRDINPFPPCAPIPTPFY